MPKLSYWQVTWIEYKLPGNFLTNKFVPVHLKPLLGEAVAKVENFSNKAEAARHVRKLPELAHPRFFWCEGLRRYEKKVEYITTVKIAGEG